MYGLSSKVIAVTLFVLRESFVENLVEYTYNITEDVKVSNMCSGIENKTFEWTLTSSVSL